jgi:SSS family solute:Na+ symporter
MATLDWLIILAYFGSLAGLTWWVVTKNKDTADDYFLASRNLGWIIVGASIFASNIGSEHLVGLAGSGATSGVAMAHYELHAWCLLVLGWLFVPFYSRSKVFTMPEFLERRFSPAARWMLSISRCARHHASRWASSLAVWCSARSARPADRKSLNAF